MTMFEVAMNHAERGYPVFPCQLDKRPKQGLNDWENVATTDYDQIEMWWTENPDFLPAIPPGRLGLAVIDVDNHEGKDNGFESLDAAGITLISKVFGKSLSGKGLHYWHRHDVGSVNGIFPGVDRKAQGGYVVVPYELPTPEEITESLPEQLTGGIKASNVERNYKSPSELNFWLREVGAGEPDDEMWSVVEKFKPHGNQQMSALIARVVSLGAKGHPGAGMALDRMLEIWTSVAHYSGDPEEEFQVNVRSAIEKFGEPVPDTSIDDKWKELIHAQEQVTVNKTELVEALRVFCSRLRPEWEQSTNAVWYFTQLQALLERATHVDQIIEWLDKAKNIMDKVLDTPEVTR